MDNNHLHVALASDQNYAEFVAVVMVSLFDTNRWQDFATIHLLSNGIDEETIEKLRQHVPYGRGELKVYDVRTLKEDLGIDVPPTIAITAYARLFLPDLISHDVERVLYLDCDVVVSASVKDFYCVHMDDTWIAGVRDTLYHGYAKTAVGLSATDEYLNSGVLMMNLAAWREHNVTQQCLDFLLEHHGKVMHHDQGILNGVCKDHKMVVNPRFNATSSYFSHPYSLLRRQNYPFYSEQETKQATERPAIIHFTEGFLNRPWVENCVHPLREVFVHYHALTQWADVPLRPDKRSMANRAQAWSFLHLPYDLFTIVSSLITKASRNKLAKQLLS